MPDVLITAWWFEVVEDYSHDCGDSGPRSIYFLKILHYKDHSHSVWAFPSCGGRRLMNVYTQKGFSFKKLPEALMASMLHANLHIQESDKDDLGCIRFCMSARMS